MWSWITFDPTQTTLSEVLAEAGADNGLYFGYETEHEARQAAKLATMSASNEQLIFTLERN